MPVRLCVKRSSNLLVSVIYGFLGFELPLPAPFWICLLGLTAHLCTEPYLLQVKTVFFTPNPFCVWVVLLSPTPCVISHYTCHCSIFLASLCSCKNHLRFNCGFWQFWIPIIRVLIPCTHKHLWCHVAIYLPIHRLVFAYCSSLKLSPGSKHPGWGIGSSKMDGGGWRFWSLFVHTLFIANIADLYTPLFICVHLSFNKLYLFYVNILHGLPHFVTHHNALFFFIFWSFWWSGDLYMNALYPQTEASIPRCILKISFQQPLSFVYDKLSTSAKYENIYAIFIFFDLRQFLWINWKCTWNHVDGSILIIQ